MYSKQMQEPVVLTKKLSLDRYRMTEKTEPCGPENRTDYSIQSIVHHLGKTVDSGHYKADAVRYRENESKTWVSFDDAITDEQEEEHVLTNVSKQKTAYMLLYTMNDAGCPNSLD